ncbi:MAG: VOC family protein [Pseudomonadota bacterium]
MTTRIDHFMYAVASLDEGLEWAGDTFGIKPAYGGEHIGLGTRNALLSLGTTYLEIIAPDPAQPQEEGTLGTQFGELSAGGMVTWAAEGDLGAIAERLGRAGIATHGPSRTQRQTETEELLVWDLLFPVGSAHGARMPFFIDWLECANPKDTNPVGGKFRQLTLQSPDAENLASVLEGVGLNLVVSDGPPAISVVVEGRSGDILLASSDETSAIQMR